jgi:hypothetical protein
MRGTLPTMPATSPVALTTDEEASSVGAKAHSWGFSKRKHIFERAFRYLFVNLLWCSQ